ncbi:MAG: phosphoribosylaminoimidazolesuccinocarboxamide synthase [Caldilineaceae bacterium]|nr:phosphoribosylaminoimidazolesuccinocarboxamide synthase [Caldilineaceae bacterium]
MDATALEDTFAGIDLDFLGPKRSGKVRDIYEQGDRLILIATDRLSAFDHILGLVPFKGQVLNQLSAFWFKETNDIVNNHFVASPDPNVTIGRKCQPLPVEVVVRGYISGVTKTSLWYLYSLGERNIYGLDFPDGMAKNDPLPQPVITPTTKAQQGGHDERTTSAEIVEKGLVEETLWESVCKVSLDLFRRGQEISAKGGLLLVDTKYEFGIAEGGELLLIDEIHTPDSSRFWTAASYEESKSVRSQGNSSRTDSQEPENFDKEFVRLAYAAQGYRGDGLPAALPDELALEAAARYIRSYELLTGRAFAPGDLPVASRVANNLRKLFAAA